MKTKTKNTVWTMNADATEIEKDCLAIAERFRVRVLTEMVDLVAGLDEKRKDIVFRAMPSLYLGLSVQVIVAIRTNFATGDKANEFAKLYHQCISQMIQVVTERTTDDGKLLPGAIDDAREMLAEKLEKIFTVAFNVLPT